MCSSDLNALGQIGDKNALPALVDAESDPIPEIREAASAAIKKGSSISAEERKRQLLEDGWGR